MSARTAIAVTVALSWLAPPVLLHGRVPSVLEYLFYLMLFTAGLTIWPVLTLVLIATAGATIATPEGVVNVLGVSILPAVIDALGVRALVFGRRERLPLVVLQAAIVLWFWLAWRGSMELMAGG